MYFSSSAFNMFQGSDVTCEYYVSELPTNRFFFHLSACATRSNAGNACSGIRISIVADYYLQYIQIVHAMCNTILLRRIILSARIHWWFVTPNFSHTCYGKHICIRWKTMERRKKQNDVSNHFQMNDTPHNLWYVLHDDFMWWINVNSNLPT